MCTSLRMQFSKNVQSVVPSRGMSNLVELDGIEPTTPCLQSRCSTSELQPRILVQAFHETWWAQVDSNYRPHAYQACALTD